MVTLYRHGTLQVSPKMRIFVSYKKGFYETVISYKYAYPH